MTTGASTLKTERPRGSGSPRRLLLLVNILRRGGTERSAAMLSKHIDKALFAPTVWSLLEGGDYETMVAEQGVPVRHLGRRRALDPLFALKMARDVAHSGADVIQAYHPACALPAVLARVLWKMKTPLVYYEGLPNFAHDHRRRDVLLRRWFIPRCTHYVANSRQAVEFLVRQGAARARIRLIPNGHERPPQLGAAERLVLRREMGAPEDLPLAIFVGRLIPSKRTEDLIDAAAAINAEGERLAVAIVGDGPERNRLSARVAAAGAGAAIKLLGTRDDVPRLLQAADLFVFPSESEASPNAVIEAAMAGLPIIACDIPAVREILGSAPGPRYFPARHVTELTGHLRGVLENLAAAKKLAHQTGEIVEKAYAIKSSLERLYDFYREILSETPPVADAEPGGGGRGAP